MDKLSFIIRELLNREGKAFLPGVGVLTMHRTGAQIETSASIIHPPNDQLDLLASSHIQFEHFEKQLDRLNIPSTVDIDLLKKEIEGQFIELKEGDSFQFGDWLELEKDNSGDYHIRLLDAVKLSSLNSLPELSLPVGIGSGNIVGEVATANAIQAPPKKTNYQWKVPALLTALVLVLSFIVWWNTPEWRSGEDAFSKLLVKEERVNISPSEITTPPSSKDGVTEEPYEGMEKTPLIEDEKQSNEQNEEDMVPGEANADSNNINSPQDLATEAETHTEECVIVVGSFARNSNVEKMKDRLLNEGHKVFTQDFNGLTRVGLYTSCAPDPLDSVLNEARTNIEEAAWLLDE